MSDRKTSALPSMSISLNSDARMRNRGFTWIGVSFPELHGLLRDHYQSNHVLCNGYSIVGLQCMKNPLRGAKCKEFLTIHPSLLLGGFFFVRVRVATSAIHWTADRDHDWPSVSVRSHTGPLIDMRCRWERIAIYLD